MRTPRATTSEIEFPAKSLQDWLALAGVESRASERRTRCGIPMQSLYLREDISRTPVLEKNLAASRPWRVGQTHDHPDINIAASMIDEDLKNDVDVLLLQWSQAVRQPSITSSDKGGISVACLDDLAKLLAALKPSGDKETPMLALDAGAFAVPTAAMLLALWKQWGNSSSQLSAFLGIDPLATLAAGGGLSLEGELAAMSDAALYVSKHHPKVSALGVRTSVYHLAGASDVQELALAMASGKDYLETLLDAGMEVDAACAQLVFTLNADTDFFPQIAKFRAARILWSRITEAFGASEQARVMNLQGESALRFLTRYDPWVNIARSALAGCAATIGGADGLLLHPFTRALGVAEKDARRIARNTHFLLSEEALLGEVVDAAGDCWSVEALTHDMAQAAWALFQEICSKGGMATALRSGKVAAMLQEQREWRGAAIATASARIVGVNMHPSLAEESPAVCSISQETRDAADGRILKGFEAGKTAKGFAELIEHAAKGASLGELAKMLGGAAEERITPLPQERESEAWERLRERSDSPKVFLLQSGAGEGAGQWRAGVEDLLNCAGMQIVNSGYLNQNLKNIFSDFKESTAEFALILDDGEGEGSVSPEMMEAAQQCSSAGAKGVWLWRKGVGIQGDGSPFSLLLDSKSDLPKTFASIYESLGAGART